MDTTVGYKTSEFYVTVATWLLSIFGKKLGLSSDTDFSGLATTIAAGVASVVYIIGRAKVKSSVADAKGNAASAAEYAKHPVTP